MELILTAVAIGFGINIVYAILCSISNNTAKPVNTDITPEIQEEADRLIQQAISKR